MTKVKHLTTKREFTNDGRGLKTDLKRSVCKIDSSYLRSRSLWLGVELLVIVLCLAGCAPQSSFETPDSAGLEATPTPGLIIQLTKSAPKLTAAAKPAATIVVAPTATQAPLETAAKPSPTLICTDNLSFVADLTVPDGTLIGRGAQVDKRWQVLNSGTCNWDSRYKLVLIAGPEMETSKEQKLFPARSGAEAMIRMLLTAPSVPGVYTSAWQAVGPEGDSFGEIIYLEIQVN